VPSGDLAPETDRDQATGRFVRGNRAALVVGERSNAFWAAHVGARAEIRDAVLTDAGAQPDASRALYIAADGLAQATLLRDAAYLRLVELGGPMTKADRPRRAFQVWLSAGDRVERYLRLVGLERKAKNLSLHDYLTEAGKAEP
jgi:hypothetical protein